MKRVVGHLPSPKLHQEPPWFSAPVPRVCCFGVPGRMPGPFSPGTASMCYTEVSTSTTDWVQFYWMTNVGNVPWSCRGLLHGDCNRHPILRA